MKVTQICVFLFIFSSGDEQAIPIVPLSEENEDAMDNKVFQNFLKTVGISAPSSHEVKLQ